MQSTDSEYDSDSEEGAASLSNYPGASDVGPGVDSDTGSDVDSDPEMSSFEHDEEAFVVAPFYAYDSVEVGQAEDPTLDGGGFDQGLFATDESDCYAPGCSAAVHYGYVAPVGTEDGGSIRERHQTMVIERDDVGFEDCMEIWGE